MPTWTRDSRPPAPAPLPELHDEPVELLEPEPTPVEQLFGGGQFAAPTAPSRPDAREDDDVDLTGEETPRAAGESAKRRLGLGFKRKTPADAPVDAAPEDAAAHGPVAEVPAEPGITGYRRSGSTTSAPVRTEPYVPPGGFSGTGHPRLGPLAPVPADRHPGLAGLDVAAIALAVVLPPVGLITAIVAIIRGKRIRGWASDLARAAVSISVIMTLVFIGVGGYVWMTETEKAEQLALVKAEQRAHDRVAAASAPFCDVLAANPTIYSTADPDYGWPALDAPAGYNTAIAEYAGIWAQLAAVAPEGIAAETAAISERVAGVVNIANALGSSNRAGDLLGLHAKDDLATVESWYVEYCNPPEIPAG
jgi:hypothetical protein